MLNLDQQIAKQIEKSENILIAFNADWNGDAVASALALYLYLAKKGKKAEVAAQLNADDQEKKRAAETWKFLPKSGDIQHSLKNLRKFIVSLDISQAVINQIRYSVDGQKLNFIISPEKGWFRPEDISTSSSGFKHDLIFTIDSPDLESLGSIYDNNVEFFYKTTIINIDHQAANEEYGQINLLDLNVASTAEVLYGLIKTEEGTLDEDIATCLFAGIISKTRNFKSANLTPRTLLTSSKLISAGARREEIISELYRSRPLSVLKLWGKLLNNLQSDENKRLLWTQAKPDEIDPEEASHLDLNEIVDEILAGVPEAKLILIGLPLPQKPGRYKLSVFAAKGISAVELLKAWSASGSARTATAEIDFPADQWEEKIIGPLKAKLDKNFG
ncbi:MAG: DHH family phosphoesterase [Bacillota bacterium]